MKDTLDLLDELQLRVKDNEVAKCLVQEMINNSMKDYCSPAVIILGTSLDKYYYYVSSGINHVHELMRTHTPGFKPAIAMTAIDLIVKNLSIFTGETS